jgi:hypothetical protein
MVEIPAVIDSSLPVTRSSGDCPIQGALILPSLMYKPMELSNLQRLLLKSIYVIIPDYSRWFG